MDFRGPGDPNRIARAIQNYLEDTGTTGAELAKRLGFSAGAVSQYRNGQLVPSASRLVKLARVIGVDVRTLLRPEFGGFPEEGALRA